MVVTLLGLIVVNVDCWTGTFVEDGRKTVRVGHMRGGLFGWKHSNETRPLEDKR